MTEVKPSKDIEYVEPKVTVTAYPLILQCHLYKHWGILYLWTGEEKDDRG